MLALDLDVFEHIFNQWNVYTTVHLCFDILEEAGSLDTLSSHYFSEEPSSDLTLRLTASLFRNPSNVAAERLESLLKS